MSEGHCALFRENSTHLPRDTGERQSLAFPPTHPDIAQAPMEPILMTATKISSARAQVTDYRALSVLLQEVPEAEEIRALLSQPYFARRWQQSMRRSFWISSDGNTALCLTLTGLDVDEMVAIWVAFDGYRTRPGFNLSAASLGEIIESELGVDVELES